MPYSAKMRCHVIFRRYCGSGYPATIFAKVPFPSGILSANTKLSFCYAKKKENH